MQIVILDYLKETLTIRLEGKHLLPPIQKEEIKLCLRDISPINLASLGGNICLVMTNLYARVCKHNC